MLLFCVRFDKCGFSVLISISYFLMKVIRTKILSSFVLKPTGVNVLTRWLAGDLMPHGPQLGQDNNSGFETQGE